MGRTEHEDRLCLSGPPRHKPCLIALRKLIPHVVQTFRESSQVLSLADSLKLDNFSFSKDLEVCKSRPFQISRSNTPYLQLPDPSAISDVALPSQRVLRSDTRYQKTNRIQQPLRGTFHPYSLAFIYVDINVYNMCKYASLKGRFKQLNIVYNSSLLA